MNPSDLALLVGPTDGSTFRQGDDRTRSSASAAIAADRMHRVRGRIGQSLAIGIEGAGRVVEAGSGAESLLGKLVAMRGGAMYARYCKIAADDCKQLTESTYQRALKVFGEDQTAELVYLVGGYALISMLLNAYDVSVPGREEGLPHG